MIRKAQSLGLSLDDIKQILMLGRTGRAPCASVLSVAERHLAELDERIEQLNRLRAILDEERLMKVQSGSRTQWRTTRAGVVDETGTIEVIAFSW